MKVTTSPNVPTGTIYLITPATVEEIERGEYVELAGAKISSNPKKHAIIRDVGEL